MSSATSMVYTKNRVKKEQKYKRILRSAFLLIKEILPYCYLKNAQNIFLLKEYIKNNLTFICYFSILFVQSESDKDVPNLIGDM